MKINLDFVIQKACSYYNISVHDFNGKKRDKNIVSARQFVMWFLKKHTDMSLKEIGFLAGRKDHSTALHSLKKINNICEVEKDFSDEIEALENDIMRNMVYVDKCTKVLSIDFDCPVDALIEQMHVHNYLERMKYKLKKQQNETILNFKK